MTQVVIIQIYSPVDCLKKPSLNDEEKETDKTNLQNNILITRFITVE